jgi:hypothetical protein
VAQENVLGNSTSQTGSRGDRIESVHILVSSIKKKETGRNTMTFSRVVTKAQPITVYLVDGSDPSQGFRVVIGNEYVVLPLEDAKNLAQYIESKIPA